MRKSLLVILLLSGVFNTLFSQNVDVEWGPEQKKAKDSYVSDVISNDPKGYYVLRIKTGGFLSKRKHFIERYDVSNTLEFSKEIKLENKQEKDCSLEALRFLKDRFVLFMSIYDSKADKNILYAQEYDREGNVMGDPEEIDNIYSKKKKNSGGFNVIVSSDGSKVLVYHNEPYEKNQHERFSYKVFDNSMKSVWQKDVELSDKDKDVSITDYKIDNQGYVYALSSTGKEVQVSGLFAKNKIIRSYKIITYDYKTDKLDEIPLTMAGSQINFVLDEAKDKIIVTGFYGDKAKGGIVGVLFTRIDKKTFKIEYETTSPFDKEFLTKVNGYVMSEKKSKKKTDISPRYSIDHIIIKEDGGIILVAEEYFVEVVTTTTTTNGITTTTTTYYYHYQNIIAVNLNSDGTIKWSSVIPKHQVSTNDGGPYSSYILAYTNNMLYVWYNDNLKNTAPKTKDKDRGKYTMTSPKKAIVALAAINDKGEVTQEAFFKSKNDTKTILKPKMYGRLKPTEVLVYAEYKSKYKFGYFRIKA